MAEINITPLTDVCIVLLVIFMCTAKFLGAGEAVDVELPGASTVEPMDDVNAIEVTIAEDGTVLFEGQRVLYRDYVKTFVELSENGSSSVIINGDQFADYGLVYDVIDAARMAHLTSVSLAAEPIRSEDATRMPE